MSICGDIIKLENKSDYEPNRANLSNVNRSNEVEDTSLVVTDQD